MPTVTFSPATDEDLQHVAARVRADDVQEFANIGMTPLETLRASTGRATFALASRIDGETVAIFGLRRIDETAAVIWIISTPALEKTPKSFLKASKDAVKLLLADRPNIYNWVSASKEKTIRWARALGFNVGPPQPRQGAEFCLCSIGDVSKYVN